MAEWHALTQKVSKEGLLQTWKLAKHLDSNQ